MIPKSFTDYHRLRVRQIRALMSQAARYHTVAAVHDLRVEIKRLRAFHKLIAAIAPSVPSAESWRPVRKLFRAAAPLRDFQVQWDFVLEAARTSGGNLSEYLNFLKAGEIASRARFTRTARAFPRTAFATLLDQSVTALASCRPERVIALTSGRLQTALDELVCLRVEEPFDDEKLHQVRIAGKEARYVLEVLRYQAPPDDWYERLDRALKTLHQTLGRWHDAVVGGQYLATFLKTEAVTPLFNPLAYDALNQRLEATRSAELAGFNGAWPVLMALIAEVKLPTSAS